MKVTLLGTGTSQGVPVIGCHCEVCRSVDYRDNRLRVSVHLQVNGKSFIIDSGPDFRQQALRERIRTLDALIFTHEHKDHTAGLDDIRAYNFSQHKDMPLYGEERVLEQLKREFAYIFSGVQYPGIPRVQLNPISEEPFEIEGVEFIPIRVKHYKLPVLGFRVGDFTYITDANFISEEEMDKVRGSKVIVLGALRKEPHISHFSLQEAIDVLTELKPERAYLTHISHLMGLHHEVELELPDFIRLGYDGLQIEL
ncbi:MBL fold metallo-hydrolase [Pontibacter sp. BT310]|uniref:MBL fold metallo-hydrolase n=1 Tax=Pontibacter populi TaxID=890055 RepID=A0ABS6X6G2_9BACT|nr:MULTISPECIES: MBL fold metallo-hydrolase [Pontibacter]MBJ6116728.1 MBL fold metallo-hydrolase [Pontibacter sp. BT310]MBR0569152.1 MBL fold metallo-hydrolase [Microvirga sp. STS03]MBW3363582.1 MBL fold metallo-hydrolase [Pontibacter populi]